MQTASTGSATFSGRAYPNSTITLLKDATIIATTRVGSTASFDLRVDSLLPGLYLFNLYSEDSEGNRSALTPLPITAAAGVTTAVSGIFLGPTISTDKEEVKRGNPITVFGRSVPESRVVITVNSETEQVFDAKADKDGIYSHTFTTEDLELGNHSTHSRAALGSEVSVTSRSVAFRVSTKDVVRSKTKPGCPIRGDLNNDCRVNLVDFSIAAFWYKKAKPPAHIDLNGDGQVNLIDFSIMAFNWTG